MPRIFRDWWKVFILHALMYASIMILIYKFRIKIPGIRHNCKVLDSDF